MPRRALGDDHRASSRGVPGGKRDADGRAAAAEPDRRVQRRDVREVRDVHGAQGVARDRHGDVVGLRGGGRGI